MKRTVFVLIAAVMMLFCSCSVQTEFDVKNYCDRFNSLVGDSAITTEDFFSDGEEKLFTIIDEGNSKMLVSLDLDEKNAVKSMGVSLFCDATDSDDLSSLISKLSCAVGAFFYPDGNAADEIIQNLGITGGENPFENRFTQYEYGKHVCYLFSDPLSLTVKIDKLPSDSVK